MVKRTLLAWAVICVLGSAGAFAQDPPRSPGNVGTAAGIEHDASQNAMPASEDDLQKAVNWLTARRVGEAPPETTFASLPTCTISEVGETREVTDEDDGAMPLAGGGSIHVYAACGYSSGAYDWIIVGSASGSGGATSEAELETNTGVGVATSGDAPCAAGTFLTEVAAGGGLTCTAVGAGDVTGLKYNGSSALGVDPGDDNTVFQAEFVVIEDGGAALTQGDLDLSSQGQVKNLVDPTSAQDAATKNYHDANAGTTISGAGPYIDTQTTLTTSMTGNCMSPTGNEDNPGACTVGDNYVVVNTTLAMRGWEAQADINLSTAGTCQVELSCDNAGVIDTFTLGSGADLTTKDDTYANFAFSEQCLSGDKLQMQLANTGSADCDSVSGGRVTLRVFTEDPSDPVAAGVPYAQSARAPGLQTSHHGRDASLSRPDHSLRGPIVIDPIGINTMMRSGRRDEGTDPNSMFNADNPDSQSDFIIDETTVLTVQGGASDATGSDSIQGQTGTPDDFFDGSVADEMFCRCDNATDSYAPCSVDGDCANGTCGKYLANEVDTPEVLIFRTDVGTAQERYVPQPVRDYNGCNAATDGLRPMGPWVETIEQGDEAMFCLGDGLHTTEFCARYLAQLAYDASDGAHLWPKGPAYRDSFEADCSGAAIVDEVGGDTSPAQRSYDPDLHPGIRGIRGSSCSMSANDAGEKLRIIDDVPVEPGEPIAVRFMVAKDSFNDALTVEVTDSTGASASYSALPAFSVHRYLGYDYPGTAWSGGDSLSANECWRTPCQVIAVGNVPAGVSEIAVELSTATGSLVANVDEVAVVRTRHRYLLADGEWSLLGIGDSRMNETDVKDLPTAFEYILNTLDLRGRFANSADPTTGSFGENGAQAQAVAADSGFPIGTVDAADDAEYEATWDRNPAYMALRLCVNDVPVSDVENTAEVDQCITDMTTIIEKTIRHGSVPVVFLEGLVDGKERDMSLFNRTFVHDGHGW